MAGTVAEKHENPSMVPRDPDSLYEVIGGRVVEKVMGAFEGDIATLLSHLLFAHVWPHQLGRVLTEVLFLIDRESNLRRRPDVAFLSDTRCPWDSRAPEERTPG